MLNSIEHMLNNDALGLNRKKEVDLIRSLALLGICVVNLPFMALPPEALIARPENLHDQLALFLCECLFQGKFFLIFSFVFGWSFAEQRTRADNAHQFRVRMMGRTVLLATFGIAHALFVFTGDILLLYAFLVLGLMPLSEANPRLLIRIATVCLPLAIMCFMLLAAIYNLPPNSELRGDLGGNYVETMRWRWHDWPNAAVGVMLFNGPLAFAAFLCGLAAGKTGFLNPGASAFSKVSRAVVWICPLGVLLNVLYAYAMAQGSGASFILVAAGLTALAFGAPMLAACYLILFVNLARTLRIPDRWLAAGRNSLSAYLLQGIIAGTLFGSYGFGLFGKLGFASITLIAAVVWLAVCFAAALWSLLYAKGPFELLMARLMRMFFLPSRRNRWNSA